MREELLLANLVHFNSCAMLNRVSQVKEYISNNDRCMLIFIVPWSTPCKILLQRLTKTQSIAVVNVDCEDALRSQFCVPTVPFAMKFSHGECIWKKLISEPYEEMWKEYIVNRQLTKEMKCKNGHIAQMVNKLSSEKYQEYYFRCNQCEKVKIIQNNTIGHCEKCDYDICTDCCYQSEFN